MDKQEKLSEHEQVRRLANSTLYVLEHSYYRGEDSHLVEVVKQWMKTLRDDISKHIELEAKKLNEEANKPVEAVTEAK